MDILYVIVLSLVSIAELFILCKLMGYRQLSQMSMFDYVNGITIGNIAAEMATSVEDNFIHPLIAMIIYATTAVFLSWLSSKSIRARRIISGKPILLMHKGELFQENFKKSKVDLNEFTTQCRINGYFDLSQLESAILEENGHISFLPKTDYRPVTPKDMALSPSQEHLVANVIINGHIMPDNLKAAGKDERWLTKELHSRGISHFKDVFLATCDLNNQLTIFMHTPKEFPPDIFS